MSYPYFFVDSGRIEKNEIKIIGEDLNHLKNVLRGEIGDTVYISDNEQYKYKTEILKIGKNEITLATKGKEKILRKFPEIILFQCVLKKNPMEFVIQKSTEIGVDRIVPVISRRTIVDSGKVSDKLARWQKISDGASMQCKRDFSCRISSPEDIHGIMVSEYDYFFIPYEKSANYNKIISEDADALSRISAIGFIIGPEGGFEENELNYLKKNGAREIKLGKNIYRSETAAIYFLSVLDYLIGNKRWTE